MKITIQKPVRVRFAPSPTGHLHIGSLRTALFNWLFARHYDGTFLIRIEDTDTERSKKEYIDAINDALRWVDIDADEPVVIQSERLKEHQIIIARLLQEGKAYKCYCSQEDVVARAGDKAFIKYDGYCRQRSGVDKPYVVRFKLPDSKEIVFDDLIRGMVRFERDQLDDFIIARSDGRPMYNFVVVVDDAAMQISQIIRGEDHISNTPKQILLYEACGYQLPQFAHIPLILGPSGDRLSKRDGATSVMEYKKEGYLPDALINYLVRLGWSHGDQEIFSRKELIDYFTLEGVGKKGAIFDREKLNWLNGVYIKKMSDADLLSYMKNSLHTDLITEFTSWSKEMVMAVITLYKERVITLGGIIDESRLLYHGPKIYSAADVDAWVSKDTKNYLALVVQALTAITDFTADACANAIKAVAKNAKIKLAPIAQPVRIALLGKSSGPGVFELLAILGKKESVRRIVRLSEHI